MLKTASTRRAALITHTVMIFCSACALIPFIVIISSSFSDDMLVLKDGYSILPRGFSTAAYDYIFSNFDTIGRAYLVTVAVTVIGTVAGLIITSMGAYMVAQDNLPGAKLFTFLIVFAMLFNGGLTATYYTYSNILHIKDTLWALIVPGLLVSYFDLILVRNYYRNNVPKAVLESARLDGAGEFMTYFRIVFPLSLPITATIGLLTAIKFWNDWQNGLYYLNGTEFYSIQQVLRVMSTQINFLSNSGGATAMSRNIPTTTIRMAIAVVAILPILIAYPFFQKYFAKGITIGAVKE